MIKIENSNKFDDVMLALARASNGNPVISILVVILFYLMVNQTLVMAESLVWGGRFSHWGDVVLGCFGMFISGASVKYCALLNDYMENR